MANSRSSLDRLANLAVEPTESQLFRQQMQLANQADREARRRDTINQKIAEKHTAFNELLTKFTAENEKRAIQQEEREDRKFYREQALLDRREKEQRTKEEKAQKKLQEDTDFNNKIAGKAWKELTGYENGTQEDFEDYYQKAQESGDPIDFSKAKADVVAPELGLKVFKGSGEFTTTDNKGNTEVDKAIDRFAKRTAYGFIPVAGGDVYITDTFLRKVGNSKLPARKIAKGIMSELDYAQRVAGGGVTDFREKGDTGLLRSEVTEDEIVDFINELRTRDPKTRKQLENIRNRFRKPKESEDGDIEFNDSIFETRMGGQEKNNKIVAPDGFEFSFDDSIFQKGNPPVGEYGSVAPYGSDEFAKAVGNYVNSVASISSNLIDREKNLDNQVAYVIMDSKNNLGGRIAAQPDRIRADLRNPLVLARSAYQEAKGRPLTDEQIGEVMVEGYKQGVTGDRMDSFVLRKVLDNIAQEKGIDANQAAAYALQGYAHNYRNLTPEKAARVLGQEKTRNLLDEEYKNFLYTISPEFREKSDKSFDEFLDNVAYYGTLGMKSLGDAGYNRVLKATGSENLARLGGVPGLLYLVTRGTIDLVKPVSKITEKTPLVNSAAENLNAKSLKANNVITTLDGSIQLEGLPNFKLTKEEQAALFQAGRDPKQFLLSMAAPIRQGVPETLSEDSTLFTYDPFSKSVVANATVSDPNLFFNTPLLERSIQSVIDNGATPEEVDTLKKGVQEQKKALSQDLIDKNLLISDTVRTLLTDFSQTNFAPKWGEIPDFRRFYDEQKKEGKTNEEILDNWSSSQSKYFNQALTAINGGIVNSWVQLADIVNGIMSATGAWDAEQTSKVWNHYQNVGSAVHQYTSGGKIASFGADLIPLAAQVATTYASGAVGKAAGTVLQTTAKNSARKFLSSFVAKEVEAIVGKAVASKFARSAVNIFSKLPEVGARAGINFAIWNQVAPANFVAVYSQKYDKAMQEMPEGLDSRQRAEYELKAQSDAYWSGMGSAVLAGAVSLAVNGALGWGRNVKERFGLVESSEKIGFSDLRTMLRESITVKDAAESLWQFTKGVLKTAGSGSLEEILDTYQDIAFRQLFRDGRIDTGNVTPEEALDMLTRVGILGGIASTATRPRGRTPREVIERRARIEGKVYDNTVAEYTKKNPLPETATPEERAMYELQKEQVGSQAIERYRQKIDSNIRRYGEVMDEKAVQLIERKNRAMRFIEKYVDDPEFRTILEPVLKNKERVESEAFQLYNDPIGPDSGFMQRILADEGNIETLQKITDDEMEGIIIVDDGIREALKNGRFEEATEILNETLDGLTNDANEKGLPRLLENLYQESLLEFRPVEADTFQPTMTEMADLFPERENVQSFREAEDVDVAESTPLETEQPAAEAQETVPDLSQQGKWEPPAESENLQAIADYANNYESHKEVPENVVTETQQFVDHLFAEQTPENESAIAYLLRDNRGQELSTNEAKALLEEAIPSGKLPRMIANWKKMTEPGGAIIFDGPTPEPIIGNAQAVDPSLFDGVFRRDDAPTNPILADKINKLMGESPVATLPEVINNLDKIGFSSKEKQTVLNIAKLLQANGTPVFFHSVSDSRVGVDGATIRTEGTNYVILNKAAKTDALHNTIVHELLHAVHNTLSKNEAYRNQVKGVRDTFIGALPQMRRIATEAKRYATPEEAARIESMFNEVLYGFGIVREGSKIQNINGNEVDITQEFVPVFLTNPLANKIVRTLTGTSELGVPELDTLVDLSGNDNALGSLVRLFDEAPTPEPTTAIGKFLKSVIDYFKGLFGKAPQEVSEETLDNVLREYDIPEDVRETWAVLNSARENVLPDPSAVRTYGVDDVVRMNEEGKLPEGRFTIQPSIQSEVEVEVPSEQAANIIKVAHITESDSNVAEFVQKLGQAALGKVGIETKSSTVFGKHNLRKFLETHTTVKKALELLNNQAAKEMERFMKLHPELVNDQEFASQAIKLFGDLSNKLSDAHLASKARLRAEGRARADLQYQQAVNYYFNKYLENVAKNESIQTEAFRKLNEEHNLDTRNAEIEKWVRQQTEAINKQVAELRAQQRTLTNSEKATFESETRNFYQLKIENVNLQREAGLSLLKDMRPFIPAESTAEERAAIWSDFKEVRGRIEQIIRDRANQEKKRLHAEQDIQLREFFQEAAQNNKLDRKTITDLKREAVDAIKEQSKLDKELAKEQRSIALKQTREGLEYLQTKRELYREYRKQVKDAGVKRIENLHELNSKLRVSDTEEILRHEAEFARQRAEAEEVVRGLKGGERLLDFAKNYRQETAGYQVAIGRAYGDAEMVNSAKALSYLNRTYFGVGKDLANVKWQDIVRQWFEMGGEKTGDPVRDYVFAQLDRATLEHANQLLGQNTEAILSAVDGIYRAKEVMDSLLKSDEYPSLQEAYDSLISSPDFQRLSSSFLSQLEPALANKFIDSIQNGHFDLLTKKNRLAPLGEAMEKATVLRSLLQNPDFKWLKKVAEAEGDRVQSSYLNKRNMERISEIFKVENNPFDIKEKLQRFIEGKDNIENYQTTLTQKDVRTIADMEVPIWEKIDLLREKIDTEISFTNSSTGDGHYINSADFSNTWGDTARDIIASTLSVRSVYDAVMKPRTTLENPLKRRTNLPLWKRMALGELGHDDLKSVTAAIQNTTYQQERIMLNGVMIRSLFNDFTQKGYVSRESGPGKAQIVTQHENNPFNGMYVDEKIQDGLYHLIRPSDDVIKQTPHLQRYWERQEKANALRQIMGFYSIATLIHRPASTVRNAIGVVFQQAHEGIDPTESPVMAKACSDLIKYAIALGLEKTNSRHSTWAAKYVRDFQQMTNAMGIRETDIPRFLVSESRFDLLHSRNPEQISSIVQSENVLDDAINGRINLEPFVGKSISVGKSILGGLKKVFWDYQILLYSAPDFAAKYIAYQRERVQVGKNEEIAYQMAKEKEKAGKKLTVLEETLIAKKEEGEEAWNNYLNGLTADMVLNLYPTGSRTPQWLRNTGTIIAPFAMFTYHTLQSSYYNTRNALHEMRLGLYEMRREGGNKALGLNRIYHGATRIAGIVAATYGVNMLIRATMPYILSHILSWGEERKPEDYMILTDGWAIEALIKAGLGPEYYRDSSGINLIIDKTGQTLGFQDLNAFMPYDINRRMLSPIIRSISRLAGMKSDDPNEDKESVFSEIGGYFQGSFMSQAIWLSFLSKVTDAENSPYGITDPNTAMLKWEDIPNAIAYTAGFPPSFGDGLMSTYVARAAQGARDILPVIGALNSLITPMLGVKPGQRFSEALLQSMGAGVSRTRPMIEVYASSLRKVNAQASKNKSAIDGTLTTVSPSNIVSNDREVLEKRMETAYQNYIEDQTALHNLIHGAVAMSEVMYPNDSKSRYLLLTEILKEANISTSSMVYKQAMSGRILPMYNRKSGITKMQALNASVNRALKTVSKPEDKEKLMEEYNIKKDLIIKQMQKGAVNSEAIPVPVLKKALEETVAQ